MEQTPMTPRGEELLRQELLRMKTVERPRIVAAIAEARSHGDLSENAEYDAAKEEQGMCEARIKDIEAKLSSANIIDVTKLKPANSSEKLKIIFGCTVTLVDIDTDKEVVYKIVGEDEADISKNLISYKTPIAKGLLGKHEGDEIDIKIPKGTISYDVVKVEYI
ncbi:MAG: transcription elongation factor GreA [Succinivibrio sp.]|jgi:transcription elongation factor GreA|nr:transcription elongation factor GreA [Succinivibrio sp.]MBR1612132.1 transcription elongation factor GreA [Succinivibrio sp.]